jgi:DNA-directed RNA polymerase specialized sigma24 family protein
VGTLPGMTNESSDALDRYLDITGIVDNTADVVVSCLGAFAGSEETATIERIRHALTARRPELRAMLKAVYGAHFTEEEIATLTAQAETPVQVKARAIKGAIEADVHARATPWLVAIIEAAK